MSVLLTARSLGLIVCLVLSMAAPSVRAQDQVERGETPSWVEAVTQAPATPVSTDEGLRILLLDTQFRAEADQQSYYVRTRSQALSPQGLPVLGSVGVAWSPASQSVTVHHVDIIRDGRTIDVLATESFETLRREENLEQATLDGVLTASLQPSGLRIGDILDVAYTIVSRDPVIAGHAEYAIDLNLPAMVDTVRYRASWPTALPVRLQASNDWVPLRVRREGDYAFVEVRRDAVQPVMIPIDVPGRMRTLNLVELSDYRAWSDIAVTLKPLYDRARRLDETSPLKAEIERIRALSDDPAVQAAAALRLVQDEVRYVALLMGDGALTPATADETWTRRFGDCKGKTALLLALLDGLGIEAEPAAVSIMNGDGMADRLPMVAAFDHVLVRAEVGGNVHWLDGTRTGDRRLADIGVPPFVWALPLSGPDARLETLVVAPKSVPDVDVALALDASAGLYAPADVVGTMVMRGEAAAVLGGQIGLISGAQKDQGLRDVWSAQLNDPTITKVGSTYDADTSVLTLTMQGTVMLDWRLEGLVPPGSTYLPISAAERPEGPFRSAPYTVNHPMFSRQVATLRVPGDGAGFRVSGGEIDRTELGHHLRRSVRLDGDQVTVETTMRSLTSEVTAEDADQARTVEATRPYDPPRVFAAADYSPTEADRTALTENAPTTPNGWLDRAFALSQTGDMQGALEAAGKAVELAPNNSTAWANRGVYRFWTGDREGAAADLEKAVDIDPSERIAMNGHALLAMFENRHDDAVIELSRALRQLPDDDWTLEMRAMSYAALEQYDRALRDMDARIAARPDDVALKLERIGLLNMAGRAEEADTVMSDLATAHPEDRIVQLNHAAHVLREDSSGAGEARPMLDRHIEAFPTNAASARFLRAKAAFELGDLEAAAEDFAAVRAENSQDADLLNNMCWEAATRGVMLEQALKDCDAAIAIRPGVANYLGSRARVLLQRGDMRDALTAYDAALAVSPDLPISLYGRGLARVALGQVAEGEADKAAAIQIAPDAADSFDAYRPGALAQMP